MSLSTDPTPAATAVPLDWKHYALTHLIYIVAIGIGIIAFHSWSAEHTARMQAEATVKAAQVQVQTLQTQIAARDTQTQIAVAPIVKIIHDTVTVPQAIAALPQVVNQPLPVPVVQQPNGSVIIPEPDFLPLFTQVADDKVCRELLTTSQADLTDTKAIVVQKNVEITALQKKPAFWKRVTGTLKTVGIGIGIGVILGSRL
jgi:hypothetical protein